MSELTSIRVLYNLVL